MEIHQLHIIMIQFIKELISILKISLKYSFIGEPTFLSNKQQDS